MQFFDSHAHYNDEKFDEDREELIKDTYKSGVTKFIVAGYDIQSSKKAIELSEKYEFIYSICGISPNDIPQSEEELWKNVEEIEQMVENKNKVVAIGEIGLDYYWNKENKEIQQKVFIKQIELANKLDLPIVIHSRDASIDTIKIISKNKVKNQGIFHCCQLNQEPITFKNSKNAEEVVKLVPLDRILIETDSPYLSPEPNRGKRNDSRNVKYIAQKISEFKNMSLEDIANITYNNAKTIFKIQDK